MSWFRLDVKGRRCDLLNNGGQLSVRVFTHTTLFKDISTEKAKPTNLPVWPFVGDEKDTSESLILW